MSLLQRYVMAELLKVFSLVLTASTLLLVFVGLMGQAKKHNLGFWQVMQVLPYVVPSLLPFTIPATLLLAVCVVYGRMSGDREIIAAKSAGINVVSLMWPSYILAAVLSAISLGLVDQTIPWSMMKIEQIVTLAMEDIFLDVLRAQNQFTVPEQHLSITVMEVRNRTLISPRFRFTPKADKPYTILAREARMDFDLPNHEVILQLVDAEIDLPTSSKSDQRSSKLFSRNDHVIRFPLRNEASRLPTRQLPILAIQKELKDIAETSQHDRRRLFIETAFITATGRFDRFGSKDFIAHKSKAVDDTNRVLRLNNELHTRISLSASCLFFVLFGSPFAIWLGRSQALTSFLFCFVPILTVYYPVMMGMQNLAKADKVDPLWGSWVANGILLAATLWVFPRVMRN